MTVVIGRQSAVTGASGSFSLANVSVPYDLSVVDPAPSATEQSRVTQLVGLHGTSPVIEVLANVAPAPGTNGASLTGTVTGGAAAPNATHTGLAVQATSAADGAIGSSFAPGTAPNKNFDIAVTWPGSQASVAPVLYALQFTPDTGIPTAYGFAGVYSDPTPVTAGGAAANLVVPLTATTDSSVAGTIVAPAGYTVGVTGLVIETTNHGAFRFDQQGASSTFSFATPVAPFLSGIEIVAYASGPAGEDSYATLAVSAGTTGNALTLPLAPSTVSPASQQSAVDSSTTFSWAPVAGEHCLYEVRAHSGLGGNPDYFLKTTSTSLTLPDLSAFGAGLPAHTAYTWVVSCTLTAGAVTIRGRGPPSPVLPKRLP